MVFFLLCFTVKHVDHSILRTSYRSTIRLSEIVAKMIL